MYKFNNFAPQHGENAKMYNLQCRPDTTCSAWHVDNICDHNACAPGIHRLQTYTISAMDGCAIAKKLGLVGIIYTKIDLIIIGVHDSRG